MISAGDYGSPLSRGRRECALTPPNDEASNRQRTDKSGDELGQIGLPRHAGLFIETRVAIATGCDARSPEFIILVASRRQATWKR